MVTYMNAWKSIGRDYTSAMPTPTPDRYSAGRLVRLGDALTRGGGPEGRGREGRGRARAARLSP